MIIVNVVDKITAKQIKKDVPEFRVGYTVKVNVKIVEGNKERIQVFEGIVVYRKGSGESENYKVRKESYGVGVERTFPIHSPKIDSIEILRKGKVRRAKLNFLKNVEGQYRIKERGQK